MAFFSTRYRSLEFTENGRDFAVAVRAPVLSTDSALNRRLAIAGLGITRAYEGHVRIALADGQLVSVWKIIAPRSPGTTSTTRSVGTRREHFGR